MWQWEQTSNRLLKACVGRGGRKQINHSPTSSLTRGRLLGTQANHFEDLIKDKKIEECECSEERILRSDLVSKAGWKSGCSRRRSTSSRLEKVEEAVK